MYFIANIFQLLNCSICLNNIFCIVCDTVIYLVILDMIATKRHCPPVRKGTTNEEGVHMPAVKDMVIKVTIWYQMKGRLGKVRNRKAEKIEVAEMEGGGNYLISVTSGKLDGVSTCCIVLKPHKNITREYKVCW
jgi:hypothetical protein